MYAEEDNKSFSCGSSYLAERDDLRTLGVRSQGATKRTQAIPLAGGKLLPRYGASQCCGTFVSNAVDRIRLPV
jgi:hypothetical protein